MFTDEMLRQAAAESNELFVNAIEKSYEPSRIPLPSRRFERAIKKLCRKSAHPVFYRTIHKVASVILAILVTGSVWLVVNMEARATFLSWIREIYENSVVYEFFNPRNVDTPSRFEVTGLPDGYEEISSFEVDGMGSFVYSKESDIVVFQYMEAIDGSHKKLILDEYTHEIVSIGNVQGDFYQPYDSSQTNELVWVNEDMSYAFQLSAFWEKGDLILLAQTIKEK